MDKSLDQLITDSKNFLSLKKFDEALKNLNLIVIKDPNNISALSTISDIYVLKKNYDEAIITFDKIIKINPKLSNIHNNKGYCLLNKGSFENALKSFEEAIRHNYNYPEAHNNCGLALIKIGKKIKAKQYFMNAIKIKKDYVQAYNNLTTIHLELNDLDKALETCIQSIKVNSKNIEGFNLAGLIHKRKNEISLSLENFNQALKIKSNYFPSLINIAKIYQKLNDYDNANKYYIKALDVDSENVNALSSFLHFKLEFIDYTNIKSLKKKLFSLINNDENKLIQPYYGLLLNDDIKFQNKITQKWCNKFLQNPDFLNLENKNSKIRIGYFSSDFKNHPVISLTKNIFKNHDKEKFDIFGFNLSIENHKKDIDENLISKFNEFFDCGFKSDDEVIKISRELKIDIAIDLNGYTKGGRSLIFRNKCAPIQINYLGYPGTMGDKSYDYIIADKEVIPEKNIKDYSEKIIFLPDCFFPNSLEGIDIINKQNKKDFEIPSDKFIFSCFNNISKINEEIVDIWSEILRSSKNSILWLSIGKNSIQHKNILNEFDQRGIDSSRIFFSQKIDYQKYLERFQLADLYLDTYPYGGHTTSIEALAAELPILTYQGETFQSRVTASLLRNLNLNELITTNKVDYIKLAVDISNNKEKLASFKKEIKKQKKLSKLFDNKNYTINLEKAFFEAYDKFSNQNSYNIDIR